jgi:hypothetical protein
MIKEHHGDIKRTAIFPKGDAVTDELINVFRGGRHNQLRDGIVSFITVDEEGNKDSLHIYRREHETYTELIYEGPRFTAKVIERLLKMGLKDRHIYSLLTIPVPYGFLRRDHREMVIVRNQEEFDLLNQYTTFTEKLPDAPNPFPYLFGVEENEDYGSNVLSNMSLREGAEYLLELSKFLEKTKAIIDRENETAIN